MCGRPTIAEAFVATGLLALLDDITSILDDVSAMTKVAAGKTAGVLGDDLALNAQQVAEVRADRELPVVWAVAKGSALNKTILVPMALAISAFAPWLVTPLLMVGGAYLCFEGVEKLVHPWLHRAPPDRIHLSPLRTSGPRCERRCALILCCPLRSSLSPSALLLTDRWRHRSA